MEAIKYLNGAADLAKFKAAKEKFEETMSALETMTPEAAAALKKKVEGRMARLKELLAAKDWEAIAAEFGLTKECLDPDGLGEAGHGHKKLDLDGDSDLDLAASDSTTPGVALFSNLIERPIPACEPDEADFRRGDSNRSGDVDISDPIGVLFWLFTEGEDLACLDAADADDDGVVDISDPVEVLGYLFLGGPPPALPGPSDCGPDPVEDGLPICDYEGC